MPSLARTSTERSLAQIDLAIKRLWRMLSDLRRTESQAAVICQVEEELDAALDARLRAMRTRR